MQNNPDQILRAQIADLQAKISHLYEKLGEPSPYPPVFVTADDAQATVSAAVADLARNGQTVAAINQLRAEQSIDLRTAKRIVESL